VDPGARQEAARRGRAFFSNASTRRFSPRASSSWACTPHGNFSTPAHGSAGQQASAAGAADALPRARRGKPGRGAEQQHAQGAASAAAARLCASLLLRLAQERVRVHGLRRGLVRLCLLGRRRIGRGRRLRLARVRVVPASRAQYAPRLPRPGEPRLRLGDSPGTIIAWRAPNALRPVAKIVAELAALEAPCRDEGRGAARGWRRVSMRIHEPPERGLQHGRGSIARHVICSALSCHCSAAVTLHISSMAHHQPMFTDVLQET